MSRRTISRIVSTLVLVFLLYSWWHQRSQLVPPSVSAADPTASVITHVVDGDTFDVAINGHTMRVRMIGMDTPETVKPNTPVQCYGPEASAKGKAVLSGQTVTLSRDPIAGDSDQYGRALRYVTLPDGSDYGQLMISAGYAREYDFKNQPYAHRTIYRAAQTDAQANHRGLWSADTCNGGR